MAHGLMPPLWLRQPLAVGVHSSLSPSPSFFFLFYSRRVGCAPVVHGCERMPSASLHTWNGTQEWVALGCFAEKSWLTVLFPNLQKQYGSEDNFYIHGVEKQETPTFYFSLLV